jgi:hypothetical protein
MAVDNETPCATKMNNEMYLLFFTIFYWSEKFEHFYFDKNNMNFKIHKFFYFYRCKYHLNFNVITTGRNLAQMCMYEYPKLVKYGLWLLIEVGVIAATIPGGIDFVLVCYFSLVWL